jgi:hypothetical protein
VYVLRGRALGFQGHTCDTSDTGDNRRQSVEEGRQVKQQRFGFKRTIKAQVRDYDVANLRSAKEILANPSKFDGPGSGLYKWAEAVIARIEGKKAR